MLKHLSFALAGATVAAAIGAWGVAARPTVANDSPPKPAETAASALEPAKASSCRNEDFEAAAEANARSLHTLTWSPFGRAERGWETYAPRIAVEIGADCGPETSAFAKALADWQRDNGLTPDARMSPSTFQAMKTRWQADRLFVAVRASGICPSAPVGSSLVRLDVTETYHGKDVMLRSDVADAYRTMVAAAKREVPELADDVETLDVFSGFRSPAYDDARCARDGNCGGITRAKCSAHRTGYTLDLVVGSAPGQPVDSTNDTNRLHMSKTPAYRWLVANSGRFGFVNYVFEPWHWEYRGASEGTDPRELRTVAAR